MTTDEIKKTITKSWHKASLRAHPDRGGTVEEQTKLNLTKNRLLQILTDAPKKVNFIPKFMWKLVVEKLDPVKCEGREQEWLEGYVRTVCDDSTYPHLAFKNRVRDWSICKGVDIFGLDEDIYTYDIDDNNYTRMHTILDKRIAKVKYADGSPLAVYERHMLRCIKHVFLFRLQKEYGCKMLEKDKISKDKNFTG